MVLPHTFNLNSVMVFQVFGIIVGSCHLLYIDVHDTQLRLQDIFVDGVWRLKILYTHGLLADVGQAYSTSVPKQRSFGVEVSWKCPSTGWVSLNVDGSAMNNPNLATFGGLI